MLLGSHYEGLFNVMEFTQEQLNEIKVCVAYYMQRHISINDPRYQEYEVILKTLNKTLQKK